MAARTYPNDYFAWFNDDQRLAILELDTTSTTSSERTTEKYDSFQGDGNLSGIMVTDDTQGSTVTITSGSHGLITDDRIAISGCDTAAYNTNFSITYIDANTFRISVTNSESTEIGSWTSLFIDNGLRITYKSKFEEIAVGDALTKDLDTDYGLDTSLQPSLVCYVKSRLYEDQGNFEQSNYFKQMYESSMMKQRSRKSGVRGLAVPNL